ncbi:MAG: hypothetical protein ABSA65_16195 [Acidimicrobiales bacterium]
MSPHRFHWQSESGKVIFNIYGRKSNIAYGVHNGGSLVFMEDLHHQPSADPAR